MTGLRLTLAGAGNFKQLSLTFFLLLMIGTSVLAGRLKVERIEFVGNRTFTARQLREVIKTERKKPFNNKLLNLDRILLTNYYQMHGFLEVWVDARFKRKGDRISVTYTISEGKRYYLGGIEIRGAKLVPAERFRKAFKINPGDVYNRQKIEEGLNRIENYYYNHGKPYVVLDYRENRRDSLIDVQVNIQENETVVIADIAYEGLQRVKSFIIRRELEIKKGEVYSREKINRSKKNIYSTGLFDFVGMSLEPLGNSRSRVRLKIKVVERKSLWVGAKFGVAYEQATIYGGSFDFTLEFGNRDLFGTGRTVFLQVIPSLSYDFVSHDLVNTKNQYSLTYIEPWIGYTRTPGIFQIAYYQVRPINSANYNNFVSFFQVKHDFSNHWRASSTLQFSQVQILEDQPLDSVFFAQTRGQDAIYSFTGSLVRDYRDNYLVPLDGYLFEINGKFAYSITRVDSSGQRRLNRFLKLVAQWNRYQHFPFRRNWILATRIRGGTIAEFGKLGEIPLTERFFLGGASSVRGYPEQLLGPVSYDLSGRPVALGGKLMVLGNVELRFPIFWLFWGEIFFDAGNVWAENRDFRVTDIRTTSGAGMAFITPVGPIRFDYGFKLRRKPGESPGEFHIGISFAF